MWYMYPLPPSPSPQSTHRFELLPPATPPSSSTTTPPPQPQPQAQSLNPLDLQLVRLYGQMHAAHMDTRAATFRLYRLGKDQVCVGASGMI